MVAVLAKECTIGADHCGVFEADYLEGSRMNEAELLGWDGGWFLLLRRRVVDELFGGVLSISLGFVLGADGKRWRDRLLFFSLLELLDLLTSHRHLILLHFHSILFHQSFFYRLQHRKILWKIAQLPPLKFHYFPIHNAFECDFIGVLFRGH